MLAIFGIILMAVFVVSALLLILLVLIQDESGDGMGGIFGGSSASPFGGRAGNALTRLTGVLSVVFIVSTLGLAWINKSSTDVNASETATEELYNPLEAPEATEEAGN